MQSGTATATPANWLKILQSQTAPEGLLAMSKPFPVKDGDKIYSAASDGKQLLLVRLDLGPGSNENEKLAKDILKWTTPKAKEPVPSTVGAILSALQIKQAEAIAGIKKCDGFGEIQCECICGDGHTKECDNCDGIGKVSTLKEEQREIDGAVFECALKHDSNGFEKWAAVELFGKHFDAWQLFKAFRGLPDQPVLVEHDESSAPRRWSMGHTAIHSQDGIWTAVVMPVFVGP